MPGDWIELERRLRAQGYSAHERGELVAQARTAEIVADAMVSVARSIARQFRALRRTVRHAVGT
jgi:hypothetical protein